MLLFFDKDFDNKKYKINIGNIPQSFFHFISAFSAVSITISQELAEGFELKGGAVLPLTFTAMAIQDKRSNLLQFIKSVSLFLILTALCHGSAREYT